jgi:hypothetical protein
MRELMRQESSDGAAWNSGASFSEAAANIQAVFEFRITLPAMQWESPSRGTSRATKPSGNYTVVKRLDVRSSVRVVVC